MSPKRHSRRKHHHGNTRSHRQPRRKPDSSGLEQAIITTLYRSDEPVHLVDLARTIQGRRAPGQELKTCCRKLVQEKILFSPEKRAYTIAKGAPLYTGTLSQNPKGFGFVAVTETNPGAPVLDRDIFVSATRLAGAMHGDTVLVHLLAKTARGRDEAYVVTILDRGPDTIAGIARCEGKTLFVDPEDVRYPFVIKIEETTNPQSLHGKAVITRIKPPQAPLRLISGTIVEILGSPADIDVQMRLVIEKFNLPHSFSFEARDEAAALRPPKTLDEGREDLRDLLHVTIDGETAKDFDDAIYVEQFQEGYRLYVSIADVSWFVRPGSAIDREAYERGTSIYFPGRVIPMLPEELSNDLCSLLPEQDRLTVTARLDFDQDGKMRHSRFCRSVIRSHQRFTYSTVTSMLVDKDPAARKRYSRFLPMLETAERLARALHARRVNRGSLGFTIPEAEMELDDDGRIASIRRAKRTFAHQIIEEFMLAANEAVAGHFTNRNVPAIYRIHELPDQEKVVEFARFAKTLDLQLPEPELRPDWFGKVLTLCQGTPKEYIVNNLLLRTMQQARYAADNVGHFALATSEYTHFTSPIRRYPDLMVHRQLCRLLAGKGGSERGPADPLGPTLSEAGQFLSARERTAVQAEREMAERLKLAYMEHHLGETFEAIISGVSDSAIYVELLELFISGPILLEDLTDDYYLHDAKHHRLIGQTGGRRYQLGDIMKVTAIAVDRPRSRVLFQPANDTSSAPSSALGM